ncbi:hypothetical protein ACN20G_25760 [Streptomyces sp. BI20]|uniref:hypothetical protein n=1 Tax=Streptomyces sp. BI20 TaxID=3403460 RepID=UPI003C74F2D7
MCADPLESGTDRARPGRPKDPVLRHLLPTLLSGGLALAVALGAMTVLRLHLRRRERAEAPEHGPGPERPIPPKG